MIKATVSCVHCKRHIVLGWWALMPNPYNFSWRICCGQCHTENRVAYYWSFPITMASILMVMFTMILCIPWISAVGKWALWIPITFGIMFYPAALMKCYFYCRKQPFVGE